MENACIGRELWRSKKESDSKLTAGPFGQDVHTVQELERGGDEARLLIAQPPSVEA